MTLVGSLAPVFQLPCTRGDEASRNQVQLADYRGQWLMLIFYPRDFSMVCPTELTAISQRIQEFTSRGCQVLAISTDTLATHERWIQAPRAHGGLSEINFPLGSDEDGMAARAYGVYLPIQRVALRGLFLIDPNGVLQYQAVHNLSVGRNSEELVRILAALQTGGMCPESWCVDCATLDPTRVLGPGNVLSHYRIEHEVGRGGFASVFRAMDLTLQRSVALKVFKQEKLSSNRVVLAEARVAASLSHPNVCTIFAVDDSEGVPFIAMEYVEGRSLGAILDKGMPPREEAISIGRQIALGMASAHRAGIVHGDLKPANILVTEQGMVKITDFGLSRREEPVHPDAETSELGPGDEGAVAGTPHYMSPEQTNGEPANSASDVFALGLILYELATGRKPYTASNVLHLFRQIRETDSERLARHVGDPFTPIIRQGLIPDRQHRSLTMEAIAEALTLDG